MEIENIFFTLEKTLKKEKGKTCLKTYVTICLLSIGELFIIFILKFIKIHCNFFS
jgi:hypothetical protein